MKFEDAFIHCKPNFVSLIKSAILFYVMKCLDEIIVKWNIIEILKY